MYISFILRPSLNPPTKYIVFKAAPYASFYDDTNRKSSLGPGKLDPSPTFYSLLGIYVHVLVLISKTNMLSLGSFEIIPP